ncbi:MAG TPA: hypothetical protein VJU85_06255 [Nitrososphaeraceae archaeon]|nr:hypothetical protein [Nitrososphaeraceae archaeon]
MLESILQFVPLMSIIIVSGLLVFAFINFSITRKNMQRQSEQQITNLKIQNEQEIYSRIIEARLKLENTEEFTKMASESNIFRERFALVDSPSEYYTIVSFLDLFEYVFRLNETQMIDGIVWKRWIVLTETIMTIPKFRSIWLKTKESHPDKDFREFIDSLLVKK